MRILPPQFMANNPDFRIMHGDLFEKPKDDVGSLNECFEQIKEDFERRGGNKTNWQNEYFAAVNNGLSILKCLVYGQNPRLNEMQKIALESQLLAVGRDVASAKTLEEPGPRVIALANWLIAISTQQLLLQMNQSKQESPVKDMSNSTQKDIKEVTDKA